MARRLQEYPEMQDTPLLMVTARADEEFRMKVLREGLHSYLVKPFSVQELLAISHLQPPRIIRLTQSYPVGMITPPREEQVLD